MWIRLIKYSVHVFYALNNNIYLLLSLSVTFTSFGCNFTNVLILSISNWFLVGFPSTTSFVKVNKYFKLWYLSLCLVWLLVCIIVNLLRVYASKFCCITIQFFSLDLHNVQTKICIYIFILLTYIFYYCQAILRILKDHPTFYLL